MRRLRMCFGVLRLAIACLGVVALVGRFVYGLGFATFTTTNYFGYLTTESNVAAVVVFLLGARTALRGEDDPLWLSTTRALVTCYLAVAGIVFFLLVSQSASRDYRIDVPWSDLLLHLGIPCCAVLDWLLAPGRVRVRWTLTGIVLAYPLVWGMLTEVRGSLVRWYPYFFLDPAQVGSVGAFALYGLAALLLFPAVMAALLAAARVLPTLRPPRHGHGVLGSHGLDGRDGDGPDGDGPRRPSASGSRVAEGPQALDRGGERRGVVELGERGGGVPREQADEHG